MSVFSSGTSWEPSRIASCVGGLGRQRFSTWPWTDGGEGLQTGFARLVGSGLEGDDPHGWTVTASEPEGYPRMVSRSGLLELTGVAMAERVQRKEPGLQSVVRASGPQFGATLFSCAGSSACRTTARQRSTT